MFKKKKKKFLIGGIIVVLAVGYLIFSSFGTGTYYMTVSEALGKGSAIYGQNIRIDGDVVPGSIQQESSGLVLKFTVSDGTRDLPVYYKGVVPDTFKPGNEVVIEGQLDKSGTFQASNLLPKCASKYKPA